MYEALVKRLRNCASSTVEDCDGCPYIGGYNGTYCMNGLITEAADAIEQLSNAGSAYGRGWTLGYDAGREENKPRWIPMTERLPEEGKFVLIYGDLYPIAVSRRIDWNCWQGFGRERDITHWMPLPEPPKED